MSGYQTAIDIIASTFPHMSVVRAHTLALAFAPAMGATCAHPADKVTTDRSPNVHSTVADCSACGSRLTVLEVLQATPDVVSLVQADKKIQAIKEIRAHTTWGLKEAKDAVESVWTDLGGTQRAQFNAL